MFSLILFVLVFWSNPVWCLYLVSFNQSWSRDRSWVVWVLTKRDSIHNNYFICSQEKSLSQSKQLISFMTNSLNQGYQLSSMESYVGIIVVNLALPSFPALLLTLVARPSVIILMLLTATKFGLIPWVWLLFIMWREIREANVRRQLS